jgi:N-acyl-D-aspartate/D-glutamate deacylase
MDIVIRGGTVFDAAGNARFVADLKITDGKVVAMGGFRVAGVELHPLLDDAQLAGPGEGFTRGEPHHH